LVLSYLGEEPPTFSPPGLSGYRVHFWSPRFPTQLRKGWKRFRLIHRFPNLSFPMRGCFTPFFLRKGKQNPPCPSGRLDHQSLEQSLSLPKMKVSVPFVLGASGFPPSGPRLSFEKRSEGRRVTSPPLFCFFLCEAPYCVPPPQKLDGGTLFFFQKNFVRANGPLPQALNPPPPQLRPSSFLMCLLLGSSPQSTKFGRKVAIPNPLCPPQLLSLWFSPSPFEFWSFF